MSNGKEKKDVAVERDWSVFSFFPLFPLFLLPFLIRNRLYLVIRSQALRCLLLLPPVVAPAHAPASVALTAVAAHDLR